MKRTFSYYLLLSFISFASVSAWAQSDDEDQEEEVEYVTNRVKADGISIIYSAPSFANYLPTLGPEAVRSLELSNILLNTSSGSYWKKFNYQTNGAFGYWAQRNDSVRYRSFNYYNSLLFGRALVNNKWLLINPQIGIQGSGYFLRSSANERIVPLTTLVNQPNLQLLIIQIQAIADLQVAFKIPTKQDRQVWITAKAGYYVPLNANPWIYSGRNRVTTDQRIQTNNLQFEVGIMTIQLMKKKEFSLPDIIPTPERSESSKI